MAALGVKLQPGHGRLGCSGAVVASCTHIVQGFTEVDKQSWLDEHDVESVQPCGLCPAADQQYAGHFAQCCSVFFRSISSSYELQIVCA